MKTKKLVTSAIMIAISTVLSLYAVYKLPGGGSVTFGSMVPIILLSFMFGTRWGLFSALCHALVQCVIGFAAPPVQNLSSFLIVILFDYILAFGSLGLADLFHKVMGRKNFVRPIAAGCSVFIRFLCHLVSGVVIWSVYAPEGQSPFMYSLIYNSSYMLPEILLTSVIVLAIQNKLLKHGLLK